MNDTSTIRSVWRRLFGFTDPKAQEHYAKLADAWNRPTPLVDAIMAEIQEAHDAGLAWDTKSHSWKPPKSTTRRARPTAKSNGSVTTRDLVLDIFPGAHVVGPEPTAEDWAAIEEEASHWSRDGDGIWHRLVATDPTGICAYCKPGKIIEVIEPDGTRASSCHWCGRRMKKKKERKSWNGPNEHGGGRMT